MLQLFGLVVMVAALAPICMSGGQMIAAFMLGRGIVAWVALTIGCMACVVGSGALALNVGAPLMASNGPWFAPIPAAMLLGPVWLLYWAGGKWVQKGLQR